MSVTLRCPSCGTTRDAPGECDACHDAKVRYFCDNHVPGVWLKGRTCEQCGARSGESAGPPLPPARRPTIRPPSDPGATPPPVEIAPVARPLPRSRPLAKEVAPRLPVPVLGEGASPWPGLLGAALRTRYSPKGGALVGVGLSRIRGLGGCLVRLAVVALILVIAFVAALFLFARSVLQDFGGY
jgi:hypothetical protein